MDFMDLEKVNRETLLQGTRMYDDCIMSRQLSKVLEKSKDRETQKSISEEKVVSFSPASIFPARKREAATLDGTRGIDHPTRRKTQVAGIDKEREDKRDRSQIPGTFT